MNLPVSYVTGRRCKHDVVTAMAGITAPDLPVSLTTKTDLILTATRRGDVVLPNTTCDICY